MITPYWNRAFDLDESQTVEVYRNVNKKGVTYSIRQNGYVVAHATAVTLLNAEFVVQKAGNKRVKKTGKKNVHAWIRGDLVEKLEPSEASNLTQRVVYNPKKNDSFIVKRGKTPIKYAPCVVLNGEGVWIDDSVNL